MFVNQGVTKWNEQSQVSVVATASIAAVFLKVVFGFVLQTSIYLAASGSSEAQGRAYWQNARHQMWLSATSLDSLLRFAVAGGIVGAIVARKPSKATAGRWLVSLGCFWLILPLLGGVRLLFQGRGLTGAVNGSTYPFLESSVVAVLLASLLSKVGKCEEG